jgi:hypothetical protein
VDPRAGLDDVDPTGPRTPIPPSSSPYPVAIPTALSRLLKSSYVSQNKTELFLEGSGNPLVSVGTEFLNII